VQQEDLVLPAAWKSTTACAASCSVRWRATRAAADSAAVAARRAGGWLQAGATAAAATDAAAGGTHGTLDFLLRRMRHKSDFPALGEAVVRIQRRPPPRPKAWPACRPRSCATWR
jgi:hypothetical protein